MSSIARVLRASLAVIPLGFAFSGCGGGSAGPLECCMIKRYCDICQEIVSEFNSPSFEVCERDLKKLAGSGNQQACAAEIESQAHACTGAERRYDEEMARADCL